MFIRILLSALSMSCISFGAGDEEPQQPSQPDEVGHKRKNLENAELEDTQETPPAKKQKTEEEATGDAPTQPANDRTRLDHARKSAQSLETLQAAYLNDIKEFAAVQREWTYQLINHRVAIYQAMIKHHQFKDCQCACQQALLMDVKKILQSFLYPDQPDDLDQEAIHFLKEQYGIEFIALTEYDRQVCIPLADIINYYMVKKDIIPLIEDFINQKQHFEGEHEAIRLIFHIIQQQHEEGRLDIKKFIALLNKTCKDWTFLAYHITDDTKECLSIIYDIVGHEAFMDLLRVKFEKDNTLLHSLCEFDFSDTIKTIFSLIGDNDFWNLMQIPNNKGDTPIGNIIENEVETIIPTIYALIGKDNFLKLLSRPNNQRQTLLHQLCQHWKHKQAKQILDRITSDDLSDLLTIQDRNNHTVLDVIIQSYLSSDLYYTNTSGCKKIIVANKTLRKALIERLKQVIEDENLDANKKKALQDWLAILLDLDKTADDNEIIDFSFGDDNDDDDNPPDGGSSGTKGTSPRPVINLYFNPDGTRNHQAEQAANQGNNGRQQALSVNAVQLNQNIATDNSWRNTEIISY